MLVLILTLVLVWYWYLRAAAPEVEICSRPDEDDMVVDECRCERNALDLIGTIEYEGEDRMYILVDNSVIRLLKGVRSRRDMWVGWISGNKIPKVI